MENQKTTRVCGSAIITADGEVVTARLYSRAITGPEVKRLYVDMTKTAESDAE